MSGRVLLDTNIVIALLNGDAAVLFHLEQASEVFIPAVALGELLFWRGEIKPFIREHRPRGTIPAGRAIISCDLNVARKYGRLRNRLKEKGRPLPENDIWIAAAAICYGMSLITRDSHFRQVDDLKTLDWVSS